MRTVDPSRRGFYLLLQRVVGSALLATVSASLVMCAATVPHSLPARQADMAAHISARIPSSTHHRDAWADAVISALTAQRIDATTDNVCAVLAVIAVASNYQNDPRVTAPEKAVRLELGRQAHAHHIPAVALARAMRVTSPDGRSYSNRIGDIRTQSDLYWFFDDIIRQLSADNQSRRLHNPVTTAGPMQVPIAFAMAHPAQFSHPADGFPSTLFTLQPGIASGVAYLFDHPNDQRSIMDRLGDYFVAPYASRNAALQAALAGITGERIALDGNLSARSPTAQLIARYRDRLGLTEETIAVGLRHAHDDQFEQTLLYQQLMALAQRTASATTLRIVPETPVRRLPNFEKVSNRQLVNGMEMAWHTCVGAMKISPQSSEQASGDTQ